MVMCRENRPVIVVAIFQVAVQEAGRRKRPVSRQKMHVSARGPSFNYSTQTLNSTEKSKAALRKMLYQSGNDDRYALCFPELMRAEEIFSLT